ncbi:hypothetical protein HHI36_018672 [Cryptolaemus montrouzieri]|uniref:Uncharacterized protein n=1 Tax=Cryptolaemus montrouzieri TaxID=559131 RepID=A0ABD2P1D2_9CUCU
MNPCDENLKDRYKRYRSFLNDLLKNTKNNYLKSKIAGNNNNIRGLWSCLNEMGGRKRAKHNINNIITDASETLTEKVEIADYFCKYFSEVRTKLADKIQKSERKVYEPRRNVNSIGLIEATTDRLRK